MRNIPNWLNGILNQWRVSIRLFSSKLPKITYDLIEEKKEFCFYSIDKMCYSHTECTSDAAANR